MSRNTQNNRSIAYVLAGAIAILVLLHVAAVLFAQIWGGAEQFVRWFDLDNEWSVPTVYSGILLGCTAFMTLILSTQTKVFAEKARWLVLSALFLYIAFDEQLVIHEKFAEPLRDVFSISNHSVLYHAWVLVAIIILSIVAGLILFIRSKTPVSLFQKRVLWYVAILAGGVIFLEIIGTKLYFSPLAYKLGPVLVEELFEMSMVSFILYRVTNFAFSK